MQSLPFRCLTAWLAITMALPQAWCCWIAGASSCCQRGAFTSTLQDQTVLPDQTVYGDQTICCGEDDSGIEGGEGIRQRHQATSKAAARFHSCLGNEASPFDLMSAPRKTDLTHESCLPSEPCCPQCLAEDAEGITRQPFDAHTAQSNSEIIRNTTVFQTTVFQTTVEATQKSGCCGNHPFGLQRCCLRPEGDSVSLYRVVHRQLSILAFIHCNFTNEVLGILEAQRPNNQCFSIVSDSSQKLRASLCCWLC